MNETRIFADAYQTTFADPKEMLEFLAQRAKESSWIRKPTRTLRLVPAIQEAGKMKDTVGKNWEEILEDTENNTQLALKIKGETYPVRTCAIRTILDRAGISGSGLRKLETANYAKVVNYCLKVAKGDALIKIADGKVSAVHGGDHHDYSILDMRAVFEMTMQFLNTNFPGNSYVEGSGMFDHSIVSAMWELGGNQELLDTYRDALSDHGISDNIIAPAVTVGYKLLPNHDVKDDGAFDTQKAFGNVPAWKQWLSLVILILTLLAMIFEDKIGIKLCVSGGIGALLLILTGVISEKDALKSIDLKTIFLFGGTLSLASALQNGSVK